VIEAGMMRLAGVSSSTGLTCDTGPGQFGCPRLGSNIFAGQRRGRNDAARQGGDEPPRPACLRLRGYRRAAS
jgi:hypothetical protein